MNACQLKLAIASTGRLTWSPSLGQNLTGNGIRQRNACQSATYEDLRSNEARHSLAAWTNRRTNKCKSCRCQEEKLASLEHIRCRRYDGCESSLYERCCIGYPTLDAFTLEIRCDIRQLARKSICVSLSIRLWGTTSKKHTICGGPSKQKT